MNKIGWFILISSNKDELIIAAAVFFLDDSRTILYNAKEKVRELQIENYLKKIKYFSQVSDCSEKNEFYDLESLDKINLNNIGYETGIVKKKWYKFWK